MVLRSMTDRHPILIQLSNSLQACSHGLAA